MTFRRILESVKKIKDIKGLFQFLYLGLVFIMGKIISVWHSFIVRFKIITSCIGQESKTNGKKVCVIYRWRSHCGILSHIATCLSALEYANQNDYLPVFDTRDVPHVYKPDNEKDWWELYYEPPGGITMDEFSLKDIATIVNAEKLYESCPISVDNDMEFLKDKKQLDKLRMLYRKYIRINDKTKKYIEDTWNKLTNNDTDGILGVRCRASAYRLVHPDGLSTFEDEYIVNFVKGVMKENQSFKKVFLATDDLDTISAFKKGFDEEMLLYLNEDDRITLDDVDKHIESMGDWLAQIGAFNEKTQDKYTHSLNYITEIMLLTKCQGVISNKCSAAMLLPLIKDDWEYEKYI